MNDWFVIKRGAYSGMTKAGVFKSKESAQTFADNHNTFNDATYSVEHVPVPPLSDTSPYGQGFNDWLVFGDKANAFKRGEEGFAEYERGKARARWRFK